VVIHLETDEGHRPKSYQLLKIEVADGLPQEEVFPSSLSDDWKNDETETQGIGDEWLGRAESALLRVRSAITQETWNSILNPQHRHAGQVRIGKVEKASLGCPLLSAMRSSKRALRSATSPQRS
jgi:RES domain